MEDINELLGELSFEEKLDLLEEVERKYSHEYLMQRFPEYDGEVPLTWFMSDSEIIEMVNKFFIPHIKKMRNRELR